MVFLNLQKIVTVYITICSGLMESPVGRYSVWGKPLTLRSQMQI